MTKTKILKIVNPILAVVFILQPLTGIFKKLIPSEIYE